MSEKPNSPILAKVIGAVVALAATWLVQQAISRAWQHTTGHEPPGPDDDTDGRMAEVVIAAALSGALVAVARVLSMRGGVHIAAAVESNADVEL